MWYKYLVVVIMVLIKAIFSASDTAFTYINKSEISQLSKSDRKSRKIKYFIEEKNKFYGIIEVVITMIELLSSSYAAEEFVNILAARIMVLGASAESSIIISILVVTVVLSYFLLVFGSILPRQIARNYPEKTIYKSINILWIVAILNKPFDWLVRESTKVFSKIFKIKENPKDILTEKEIKMVISEGVNQGIINKVEKSIVLRALTFDDILVSNIMIKKENVDFINVKDSKSKILKNISKYNFTRMPVYKGNTDNILGVINIKDFIIDYSKTEELDLDVNKYIRDVLYVEKTQKISVLFKNMQKTKIFMAIVIDKDKKVIGIVTMEDILEKLVGKIFDEFDHEVKEKI